MKILYAASEAQPYAASGGLADVAGSLPKALVEAGHECMVVMPYYVNTIKPEVREKFEYVTNFYVPVGWRSQYCGIFTTELNGVTYYFIDNEYYFKRDYGLYGYYDDAERFAFFSRAILEMLEHLEIKPDIINTNDWQTALVPVYYNIYYKYHHNMWGIRNVFTIHNIGYQGQYGLELTEEIFSIPRHLSSIIEYDGDANLMKGAIEMADKVTTVSPTYAKEILNPWFSHGLDRTLNSKQYKTCGFLNGLDTDMYNAATDQEIAANFKPGKMAGKQKCREALLKEAGLPQCDVPVMGIISRLVEHKGFDLIKCVMDDIVCSGIKVVILGSGEKQYEDFFYFMQNKYPEAVSFKCGYIPSYAKMIYAGADFFLMPSKSEPCGLAQMIALRYGTVPIVRATGGLKDSIPDYGEEGGEGLGFTFQSYNALDMLGAINRAKDVFADQAEWKKLMERGMKRDFSWKQSAKLYIGLYEELCSWEQ